VLCHSTCSIIADYPWLVS